jgi:hypothetical protein
MGKMRKEAPSRRLIKLRFKQRLIELKYLRKV